MNLRVPLDSEKHAVTISASWAIWQSPDQAAALAGMLDQVLIGWCFYPEAEWGKYGYRPPEGAFLTAAWRMIDGSAFGFLVDAPTKGQGPASIFHCTAKESVLAVIEAKINGVKGNLFRAESRKLRDARNRRRLDGADKSKSINKLLKLVGLFALVVNALSLYLRKIPPPDIKFGAIAAVFNVLLATVHITALALLLLLIIICIVYAVRYGILLIGRL
jgi:hypothetical protein